MLSAARKYIQSDATESRFRGLVADQLLNKGVVEARTARIAVGDVTGVVVRVNEPAPRSVEMLFKSLAGKWKTDTEIMSSISAMVMHPSYQQIIGMGREALPFILAELKRDADFWFWALEAVTRENPVAKSERGNMEASRRAWLSWGHSHGITV